MVDAPNENEAEAAERILRVEEILSRFAEASESFDVESDFSDNLGFARIAKKENDS